MAILIKISFCLTLFLGAFLAGRISGRIGMNKYVEESVMNEFQEFFPEEFLLEIEGDSTTRMHLIRSYLDAEESPSMTYSEYDYEKEEMNYKMIQFLLNEVTASP